MVDPRPAYSVRAFVGPSSSVPVWHGNCLYSGVAIAMMYADCHLVKTLLCHDNGEPIEFFGTDVEGVIL